MILLKDEIPNDNEPEDNEPELHDIAVNLSETIEPTIDEDYLNGQLEIDALSLLFSRQEFESLIIPDSVNF